MWQTVPIRKVPLLIKAITNSNVMLATERPVVAFDNCAVPEVVKQNKCGFVVPPKNHNELAKAVITLLQDEKLRKKFGHAGRKRVERLFTWELAARRTLNVYKKVLNER